MSAVLSWRAAKGSQLSGPVLSLEVPEARTLLAVQPELCAWFDRVAIVKDSAKAQWLHSSPFIFTPSLLPTTPHRTEKKHTEYHLVHFPKLTVNTTSVNTGGFQMTLPSQNDLKNHLTLQNCIKKSECFRKSKSSCWFFLHKKKAVLFERMLNTWKKQSVVPLSLAVVSLGAVNTDWATFVLPNLLQFILTSSSENKTAAPYAHWSNYLFTKLAAEWHPVNGKLPAVWNLSVSV